LTYFKQLDDRVAWDHKTLVTLSHDLKGFAQQAQEAFQEVAAKFSWAAKLRESAELITSMELALSRVEVQLDEALTALQFGINGRVPVNLVPPFVFKNILTNVSLSLPDSYELIRGVSSDLSWFYKFVSADMVATDKGFLRLLSIPLKDITTQYEMYRIFSFPIAAFDGTFTRLVIDTPYFAVNLMQHTHLLLSASDMGQCRGGPELQVCPANVAVLNNEIKSCPLSLYLQLGQAPQVCAQELLRSPPNTSLYRHGALVLFYTDSPRRAFFKCRNESQWISSAYMLNGTGLIEGASACHVSVEGSSCVPFCGRNPGSRDHECSFSSRSYQACGSGQTLRPSAGSSEPRSSGHCRRTPVPHPLGPLEGPNGHGLQVGAQRAIGLVPYHAGFRIHCLGVCLLYHLGCRFAPQWIQSLWGRSAPPPTDGAITYSEAQVEPTCSKDSISVCGAVSPSPAERFVKYPK
jgi:hypothetical protein